MDRDPAHVESAFKTPSLRNATLRPPYMHDGRFRSIDDVMRHYERINQAADDSDAPNLHDERDIVQISDADAEKLIAFLRALEGPAHQPQSGQNK